MSKIEIVILDNPEEAPVNEKFALLENSIGNRRTLNRIVQEKNSKLILNCLKNLPIDSITIEYSGSCDSGQVEAVTFLKDEEVTSLPHNARKSDIQIFDLEREYLDIENTNIPKDVWESLIHITHIPPLLRPADWKYETLDKETIREDFLKSGSIDRDQCYPAVHVNIITSKFFTKTYEQMAEDLAYALISQHHEGFEIDHGGSGTITYDIKSKKIKYQKIDYYQASETDEIELELT